ncbi:MAG: hypothetical protein LUG50_16330 [Planctomycetaceae bacterium]|nr:hypothetical protein [Planctomycetaceae bacterium]
MNDTVFRSEPGIFVRRLSIYRNYPDDLLRTIQFETGLNIVAGDHNSGKTTLYRFLRYLLGDKEYADKGIRAVIKTKLPDGGLTGEVVINGQTWLVWRPFMPKLDWVDSATILSAVDEPPILTPDAQGFAKYLAALEDLAHSFSTHPSFSGAQPVSWNDLLNLYSRDDESYQKDMYAWTRHAFGAQDALPKSKKEAWPFLLKLFGMSVAERDAVSNYLSKLEDSKQRIESRLAESQSKHQVDLDYSERLLQDANKELNTIFATGGHEDLFDAQRRIKDRLKALQDHHKESIEDIRRKAISLGETRVRLASLESEQVEHKNRELLLNDTAKADERRLRSARETLERIKHRIDDGEVCDTGRIFISSCKSALDTVRKTPGELIQDHYWMEQNEAKDKQEKESIRARLQELHREIAAAQAQKRKKEGILAEAECEERKISTEIEKLTPVISLHTRAKQLKESIQRQIMAEDGHADLMDKLTRISDEIEAKKGIVQDQEVILKESLSDVNAALAHIVKQFLGDKAVARLEMPKDNLELVLHDGNGGGGATFDTVARPLILDWLTLSYGIAGKGPHHAFFIQDSPFKSEMKVALQKAYLEMILSLPEQHRGAYQQIVLTSSSGADRINSAYVNTVKLTPDPSGRLLPGIELFLQGLDLIEGVSSETE